MPLGPLIWVHVGQTTNYTLGTPPHSTPAPKENRSQLSWKVIFQGCLKVTKQARQTTSCCFAGKRWTHSGLVQSLDTTGQDRMWGEGQKWLCPQVKGKMISVPGTNKRGMKFKKDSLRKKRKRVGSAS